MKAAGNVNIVLVTAPSISVARKLAKGALEHRLIACANLIPQMESMYWLKDAIQRDREVLMVLKTRTKHLTELEHLIQRLHPYDTPEILTLPLTSGTRRYLEWVQAETR